MSKLLDWFGRFGKSSPAPAAEVLPAEPTASANCTVSYLAADGTPLPDRNGAEVRVETEPIGAGLTEVRRYALLPGWENLQSSQRTGVDAAGQPYTSRATYWPWGQERVRITTSVEEGQPSLEYISCFATGEVHLHKKRVGPKLTIAYADVAPRYRYLYEEKMPEYPDGYEAFLQDIRQGAKYPAIALRNQEAGKVYVEFTVQVDGRMDLLNIKKGVSAALDAAVLAAMKRISQRRWRPGFQNGRAVAVVFTVPINFKI
jgi:TonB family protein